MESHGTDQRLSSVEKIQYEQSRDLQTLTVQVNSISSSLDRLENIVADAAKSNSSSVKELAAKISEVRERKVPWLGIAGVAAAAYSGFSATVLAVGLLLWNEQKSDTNDLKERVVTLEDASHTIDDATRNREERMIEEARLHRRIDRIEGWILAPQE